MTEIEQLLEENTRLKAQIKAADFEIMPKDDGVWFRFKASDKTECIVHVENLIASLNGRLTTKTIKQWCADRLTAYRAARGEK